MNELSENCLNPEQDVNITYPPDSKLYNLSEFVCVFNSTVSKYHIKHSSVQSSLLPSVNIEDSQYDRRVHIIDKHGCLNNLDRRLINHSEHDLRFIWHRVCAWNPLHDVHQVLRRLTGLDSHYPIFCWDRNSDVALLGPASSIPNVIIFNKM